MNESRQFLLEFGILLKHTGTLSVSWVHASLLACFFVYQTLILWFSGNGLDE